MDSSQRYLKIVSIIILIWGIIQALLGISNLSLSFNNDALVQNNVTFAAVFSGALALLVAGALQIAVGVLGMRGSKDASKIKPSYIIGVVCLIFNAFNQLSGVIADFNATSITALIISLILPGLYVYFAYMIKKDFKK